MTIELKPCPFCGGDAEISDMGISCKDTYCDAFALEIAPEVWNTRSIEDALRAELALVRGAMDADDRRLREAEARVLGPDNTWGCDAPDHMADIILSLRAELAAAKARIQQLESLVTIAPCPGAGA